MGAEDAEEVIRVLLVDDHPLVRAGLRALLDATEDIRVVGEAAGGEQAAPLAADLVPDVVLMDMSMPGVGGPEATRAVLEVRPGVPVVMLTAAESPTAVGEAVAAGAIGYLLKDSAPDVILEGVRAAARGEAPFDPRTVRALLPTRAPAGPILPGREEDVLRLIAAGLSNKQIGARLGIAERTVKAHAGSVFRRIGVADRVSAALWAREHLPPARPDASRGY
jgi:DNA-binding NarL/FixJ family response regulator